MFQTQPVKKTFKPGDIVWCVYSKEDRAKGFITECLKDDTYYVEVFLPRTRDERALSYVMRDVFKGSELYPYES